MQFDQNGSGSKYNMHNILMILGVITRNFIIHYKHLEDQQPAKKIFAFKCTF